MKSLKLVVTAGLCLTPQSAVQPIQAASPVVGILQTELALFFRPQQGTEALLFSRLYGATTSGRPHSLRHWEPGADRRESRPLRYRGSARRRSEGLGSEPR